MVFKLRMCGQCFWLLIHFKRKRQDTKAAWLLHCCRSWTKEWCRDRTSPSQLTSILNSPSLLFLSPSQVTAFSAPLMPLQ